MRRLELLLRSQITTVDDPTPIRYRPAPLPPDPSRQEASEPDDPGFGITPAASRRDGRRRSNLGDGGRRCPTSLSSNAVPRDIPKPASAEELAKNGNKKKSFMSNIFQEGPRRCRHLDSADPAGPTSLRVRMPSLFDGHRFLCFDAVFAMADLEEKCARGRSSRRDIPTVCKSAL
ncbi:hypothetical protein ZWY2020_050920 [Hordeum vulgare]|nr:hypothetical protein ZWY2020_050920 [Hordeum vulgare]